MQVHVQGLARALDLDAAFKQVAPSQPWATLAPWAGPAPSERAGAATSDFQPPWPDFAIGSGRQAIPYIKSIKKAAGASVYTVVLQDPRSGLGTADLIWVPQHDKLRGANVVTTITAPHGYSAERLADLRADVPEWLRGLPRPWVVLMVGGPNKIYGYGEADINRLLGAVDSMFAHIGTLLLSTSRRTPERLVNALLAGTETMPRRVWMGSVPDGAVGDDMLTENPYPHFLAHADHMVVTGDSVNMCGEAAATGRPLWVFRPEGRPSKFDRFHAALEECGVARRLPERMVSLDAWTYEPLDAAKAIASEIEKRWVARQRNLPKGLTVR